MFSGIDKEKGFTLDQTKELTRIIETGKSIAFIASSFYDFEKNDYFINGLIGFFKDISIRFNKINIIDNRISKEEAKDIVKNSDIVFMVGGNPKKEMDSINEYGLSNILRDRDGITIGVSAGSINMAKDAIYMDEDRNAKDRFVSTFVHPKEAVDNSMRVFGINEKEKDIIKSHMFPINISLPKYAESWIVSMVDKVVGSYEFGRKFGYLVNVYLILLLNIKL